MILFEDKRKTKTINIFPLIKDSAFNEIHLVGDSNGYNIANILGCSPKMISYPDSKQYKKLLLSLKGIKNWKILKNGIKTFDKIFSKTQYSYLKSSVNRDIILEQNYYKVFIKMILMSKPEFIINKNGKIMFEQDDKVKNVEIVSFFFEQLYNNLFNNNVIIKDYQSFERYLLDIDDIFYENKLFIFTPNSYLRGYIDGFNYEYLLSLLDKIQKKNGFFILIDDLIYGKKINLMLEASAKIWNRKSQVIDIPTGKAMVLTNL